MPEASPSCQTGAPDREAPRLSILASQRETELSANLRLTYSSRQPKYADKIVDLLHEAIVSTVPLAKPPAYGLDLGKSTADKAIIDDAQDALKSSTSELMSERGCRLTRCESLRRHAENRLKQVGRRGFRRFLAEEAGSSQGVFRMAQLGKRMCQPKTAPQLKNFIADDISYDTAPEMARIYREHLWVGTPDEFATLIPKPQADPGREQDFCPPELMEDEVELLINKLKSKKAAGIDELPNHFLKLAKDIIVPYLEHLLRAFISLGYEPTRFKVARTVILKKPDKATYTKPNSWRPIALLSSIGKLLEAIVARRLSDLNKMHNILPSTQFGVAGKCTTRALRHLLNPVYRAWCQKLMATLMSLDIKGAYDRVHRQKLLEILAKLKIPDWIIRFVWSFLSTRSTTFQMPGHPSQGPFFLNLGIPQGSTLSPILFLFFASPMLTLLTRSSMIDTDKVCLAYVDDTYLLVVSESYEKNCRILERLHRTIIRWAEGNDVTFEPSKYAVIHFRSPRSRIPQEHLPLPNISGLTKDSLKTELRVLGVIVDSRLTWQGHVEHIKAKVRKEMRRLQCISGSTWGLSLVHMRQLYVTKIRPIINYGCAVWFLRGPDVRWKLSNSLLRELESMQYQCLVQIAGAYRRIAGQYLLKELCVEPLEVHLERYSLAFRARTLTPSTTNFSLRCWRPSRDQGRSLKSRKYQQQHPYFVLDREARKLQKSAKEQLASDEGEAGSNEDYVAGLWMKPKVRARAINLCAREAAESRAIKLWEAWRTARQADRRTRRDEPALFSDWGKRNLELYNGLPRAQSTLLLQCRTGFGGFGLHLYRCKAVDSDKCECGEKHTAKHLFCHCPRLNPARSILFQAVGHTDFLRLTTVNVGEATDWAICFFGLAQFGWTKMHMPNRFTEEMNILSLVSHEDTFTNDRDRGTAVV